MLGGMEYLLVATVIQAVNIVVFLHFHGTAAARIVALRHQLGVYARKTKRAPVKDRDRLFWALLARWWKDWKSELVIVRPETVLRWQKLRFRDYWRKKSGGSPGRPRIPREHIAFIRRISSDHPEYGEDRITLELKLKFGVEHAESTIRRYMVKRRGDPRGTQNWSTFLRNQAKGIWCCDLFTQATVNFLVLYVVVVMKLESREIVYCAETENPTLDWMKQQVRNACYDEQPRFLIHDNDGKFGQYGRPLGVEAHGRKVSCRCALDAWLWGVMGIRGIPIPYGAPNAAAYIERVIGTVRRECLDVMLIWNERHLHAILKEFIGWYNRGRVHQGLHGIPNPDPAIAERPENGKLVALPVLNGLHHDYRLAA